MKASFERGGDAVACRRFTLLFLSLVAAGWLLLLGALMALAAFGRLPAPPLSGTPCMDAKFAFFKERLNPRVLREVNVLAAGSSVTARNLDTSALVDARPELMPFNAAMCYLHVDQAAFLALWLLERMPNVHTVLMVASMRDFQDCSPQDRAFFEPQLAGDVVFGRFPSALLYATNLGPGAVLRTFRAAIGNARERDELRFTPWGDWPMTRRNEWLPEPRTDPGCLPALRELEQALARRGVRLVFVHFLTEPNWRRAMDPDGRLVAAHRERVRRTLAHPRTVIIDGDQHRDAAVQYADPAHLLWGHTGAFTRFIAGRLE